MSPTAFSHSRRRLFRPHRSGELATLFVATLLMAGGASFLVQAAEPTVAPDIATSAARTQPVDARQIDLLTGQSETVEFERTTRRISFSKGGVVRMFMPNQKSIRLTGNKPGYTVMLIIYEDGGLERYVVKVTGERSELIERLAQELSQQLSSIEGLTVTTDGISVLLSGEVDADQLPLLEPYSGMFDGIVVNRVTAKGRAVSEPTAPSADGGVTEITTASGPPPEVETREELPLPTVTHEVAQVTVVPTRPAEPDFSHEIVQVDVMIVQISKNRDSDIGIRWFPESGWKFGGSGNLSVGNNITPELTGTLSVSEVNATVKALVEKGKGRILGTPKLTVQSGQVANFLVGGELPIVNTTGLTSTVQYKKFGTELEIAPIVRKGKNIDINLKTKISEVDMSQSVQGNPTLRSREANTRVTVPSGRSFAIAGLTASETTEQIAKVPLLGDIPLISGVFRSKRKVSREYETVIFMTPTLVRDNSTDPEGYRIDPSMELINQLPEEEYREFIQSVPPVPPSPSAPVVVETAVETTEITVQGKETVKPRKAALRPRAPRTGSLPPP